MMMARTKCGCCTVPYNLMKINPSTGAILWKSWIVPPGATSAGVLRLEPLVGTQDVIAVANPSSGDANLCRIDSTGTLVWAHNGSVSTTGLRSMGADGSNIVFIEQTVAGGGRSVLRQLDYSGSIGWTYTGWPGGPGVGLISLAVGSSQSVIGVINSGTNQLIQLLDNSSGAVVWTNTRLSGLNPKPESSLDGSNILDTSSASTVCLRDISNGNIGTIAAYRVNAARWTGSTYGLILLNGGGVITGIGATTGANLTQAFSATSIGGASLSAAPKDVCGTGTPGYADSAYYYCCSQLTGSGGTKFNIFKVDGGGVLQWTQQYGAVSLSAPAQCNCVSDDGYLYVGGPEVHD